MITKPIKGYEGIYEISDTGDVFSLNYKKKIGVRGKLKACANSNGYLMVDLYSGGVGKILLVHRIVADAFIPNNDDKPRVNHINGVRDDNRSANLEWCTDSENMHHAYDILNRKNVWVGKYGENHPRSISILQIDEPTGKIIGRFNSIKEAAISVKISPMTIRACIANRTRTAAGHKWEKASGKGELWISRKLSSTHQIGAPEQ